MVKLFSSQQFHGRTKNATIVAIKHNFREKKMVEKFPFSFKGEHHKGAAKK